MTQIYNHHQIMEMATGTGNRGVEFCKDVTMRQLSTGIYHRDGSALRELVANARTAIKNAVKLGLISDAEGLIKYSFDGTTLVVEDNGIGISEEAFHKALRVYGSTTNDDGSMAGLFGIGFFSYLLLGNEVIVETKTPDGRCYAFRCRGGRDFDILDRPTMKGHGTRVTIRVTPEKMGPLFDAEIKSMCFNIAKYLDVRMSVSESGRSCTEYVKEPVSCKVIAKRWKRHGLDPFTYEDDGIEMVGVALSHSCTEVRPQCEVRLGWMPVDTYDDDFGHERRPFRVLVNIKDERMYRPNISRNSLTEGAEEALLARIDDVLADKMLEGLAGVRDYRSLVAAPHHMLRSLLECGYLRSWALGIKIRKGSFLDFVRGMNGLICWVEKRREYDFGWFDLAGPLHQKRRRVVFCTHATRKIPGYVVLKPKYSDEEGELARLAEKYGIPSCCRAGRCRKRKWSYKEQGRSGLGGSQVLAACIADENTGGAVKRCRPKPNRRA